MKVCAETLPLIKNTMPVTDRIANIFFMTVLFYVYQYFDLPRGAIELFQCLANSLARF
jgi:hypothetical protein